MVLDKLKKRVFKEPGTAPGSVVYLGEKDADVPVSISMFCYDGTGFTEEKDVALADMNPVPGKTTWINVDGIHDTKLGREIGSRFGIHALVLEDLASPNQRPKLDIYEDYLFIVMRMPHYDGEASMRTEQVCLLLGDGWVFSFQEDPQYIFEPVRQRIRHGQGLIRKMTSDYLAYALLDTVIDHYFLVVEGLNDQIEIMEEDLIAGREEDSRLMKRINALKRIVSLTRQAIWPYRELVKALSKDELKVIHQRTRIFLADVHDHVVQITELVEICRERLQDLTNLHMTLINNRMNEVMKTLTIVGGIFIPLTFIAGVYGMNFEHMPELSAPYGYGIVMGVMGLLGGGLFFFFRRKRWF